MTLSDTTTATYNMGDGFCVDIVAKRNGSDTQLDSWVYHEDYGVKQYMFGAGDDDCIAFINLVYANFDEYRELYEEEFMDW